MLFLVPTLINVAVNFARSQSTLVYQIFVGTVYRAARNAHILNTARGDIIDEKALERVVETGRIRVALDVFEQEPPVMTSPFRFMRDDCLIQPHMGGPTMDHRAVCARIVFEDIQRWQKGEELEHEILPWRAAMMTH